MTWDSVYMLAIVAFVLVLAGRSRGERPRHEPKSSTPLSDAAILIIIIVMVVMVIQSVIK